MGQGQSAAASGPPRYTAVSPPAAVVGTGVDSRTPKDNPRSDSAPRSEDAGAVTAPPNAAAVVDAATQQQDPRAPETSPPPQPIAASPAAHHIVVQPAPKTMKAWVLRKPGAGPQDEAALTCEAAWPVIAPGKGELRVRVVCAALNPIDSKMISLFGGASFARQPVLPRVLGCDGSGVVESLGEPDPEAPFDVAPGDRVYFFNSMFKPSHGTFAEFAICDAATVCKIADSVSFADAAATPCAGWTAFSALFDKLRVQPGDSLLVLGGAGGVASFACSLAKICNCRVVATCSVNSASYVSSLGVDVVLDRNLPPGRLLDHLTALGPFDAVFDAVGACSTSDMLTVAAKVLKFGRGICSVAPIRFSDEAELFAKQLSVHYVFLAGHHGDRASQMVLKGIGDNVMQLLSLGVAHHGEEPPRRLPSHLAEIIQFRQVRQGLITLLSPGGRGKIVMSFAAPAVARRPPSS